MKTNDEIRKETPEPWRSMIPRPHPPSNCGPLTFPLTPGVRCPTCGLDPQAEQPTALADRDLRFLVTKRRIDDRHQTLASAYVTDVAGLMELARRVCPLDHLHDTAEQAQACTAPPVDDTP